VTSFGSLKEAMMSDPIPFLEQIFEAHGGLDQWRRFSKVEADIVTGGGLFPLKGLKPDVSTRRMSVWLKEERASVLPFGAPDQRTAFTPEPLRSSRWMEHWSPSGRIQRTTSSAMA
jgi:hypothetical protein